MPDISIDPVTAVAVLATLVALVRRYYPRWHRLPRRGGHDSPVFYVRKYGQIVVTYIPRLSGNSDPHDYGDIELSYCLVRNALRCRLLEKPGHPVEVRVIWKPTDPRWQSPGTRSTTFHYDPDTWSLRPKAQRLQFHISQ